jgi:predicted DNA-binding transcriptional regulator AlpA
MPILDQQALSEGRPRHGRPDTRERHLNRVMTANELADYLQIHVQTIYRNLDQFPHFHIGTEIRFLESSIRAWVSGAK